MEFLFCFVFPFLYVIFRSFTSGDRELDVTFGKFSKFCGRVSSDCERANISALFVRCYFSFFMIVLSLSSPSKDKWRIRNRPMRPTNEHLVLLSTTLSLFRSVFSDLLCALGAFLSDISRTQLKPFR